MVADVLHYTETPESTLKLSELVHTKTKGNPFFTISFLTKLYQTELIVRTVSMRKASDVHERPAVWLLELRLTRCLFVVGGQQWFNYTKGCWQWDLEKIEGMQYTDNVVEFMAQDLRKLPKEVFNNTTTITHFTSHCIGPPCVALVPNVCECRRCVCWKWLPSLAASSMYETLPSTCRCPSKLWRRFSGKLSTKV
jgi:hypothetical protein